MQDGQEQENNANEFLRNVVQEVMDEEGERQGNQPVEQPEANQPQVRQQARQQRVQIGPINPDLVLAEPIAANARPGVPFEGVALEDMTERQRAAFRIARDERIARYRNTYHRIGDERDF